MKKKKYKKPKAKFTLVFVIFWLALFGLTFTLVSTQSGRYNELRAELDGIEAEIERAQARNEDLQHELKFFDVNAYVENLARERLGMLRPNELIFRNIAE